jgi:glycosyltransferase involved in cell wall biosynthesis
METISILKLLWLGTVACYSLFLFRWAYFCRKARKDQQNWTFQGELPNVSILIALRNEEKHLQELFQALSELDFPKENLECIFINDHSTDNSKALWETWANNNPDARFSWIDLPPDLTGKKAAIRFGASQAKGTFLALTDADCLPGPEWLKGMLAVQQKTDAAMVSGAVYLEGTWMRTQLDASELAALVALGAATLAEGKPSLCNAANLLIRKTDWTQAQESRPDLQHPGGDDVFLLHHFSRMGKPLAFCHLTGTEIQTFPTADWAGLFRQRLRWAGKWKSGLPGSNRTSAIAVWTFHLIFLTGWLGFLLINQPATAFYAMVLRTLGEQAFLNGFYMPRSKENHTGEHFAMQIPYSIYAVSMGIAALFSKGMVWKGRKFPA